MDPKEMTFNFCLMKKL